MQRLNRHPIILMVIVCGIAVAIAGALLRRVDQDICSLRLSWMDNGLEAYSPKDGPFVIIHLFQPWSGWRRDRRDERAGNRAASGYDTPC